MRQIGKCWQKENPETVAVSGFLKFLMRDRLSLGELRCATSGLQTVLLSFLHSGVAGQETCSLQSGAQLGVQGQQVTGDAVTDRAGLTGNAAACDGDNNVNLANQLLQECRYIRAMLVKSITTAKKNKEK